MCSMSLTNQVFKGVFFLSGGWVDHIQYLRVDICNMSLAVLMCTAFLMLFTGGQKGFIQSVSG